MQIRRPAKQAPCLPASTGGQAGKQANKFQITIFKNSKQF
jgi:hypothetical protein